MLLYSQTTWKPILRPSISSRLSHLVLEQVFRQIIGQKEDATPLPQTPLNRLLEATNTTQYSLFFFVFSIVDIPLSQKNNWNAEHIAHSHRSNLSSLRNTNPAEDSCWALP
jgi:hypothetical protein